MGLEMHARLVKTIDILFNFCPICGKELEVHPCSGNPACFAHGDFVVENSKITFVITKSLIK